MVYNPNAKVLTGLDPNYYNKQGQGYGTNISNPLNPDGSPSWIGGSGNPLYKPTNPTGTQVSNPYDAIAKQKELALQTQRDASNKLITEQTDISRANLGGQSQASARNLAEYLAQRGLTSSGTAAQGEINRLGTLQQGIGALEQQKSNALLGVENQYQSGLATAQEEALAQAKAQEKERMSNAVATIGAYGNDYQAEINKRMKVNPNDPLIPHLQMARQEKLSGIATSTAKQKQQDFENNLALHKYNLSVSNANKPSGVVNPMSYIDAVKFATNNATSGGVFYQDTYDSIMKTLGYSDTQPGGTDSYLDRVVAIFRNTPEAYLQKVLDTYTKQLTQRELDYIKSKLI